MTSPRARAAAAQRQRIEIDVDDSRNRIYDEAEIASEGAMYGLSVDEAFDAVVRGVPMRDKLKYRNVLERREDGRFAMMSGRLATEAELEFEVAAALNTRQATPANGDRTQPQAAIPSELLKVVLKFVQGDAVWLELSVSDLTGEGLGSTRTIERRVKRLKELFILVECEDRRYRLTEPGQELALRALRAPGGN